MPDATNDLFLSGYKYCGKGENADYQQYLLFTQCFAKPPFSELSKHGFEWSRVNWTKKKKIFAQKYLRLLANDLSMTRQKKKNRYRRKWWLKSELLSPSATNSLGKPV